ncbi:MAG: MBL fold metallo-hydrolase [Candidatus Uhrbacteria bacterium]|nr:MBL fold metallo-hydrolase [Candidatus Uhrbacteria bacterium]
MPRLVQTIKKSYKEIVTLALLFAITLFAHALVAGTWLASDELAVWVFDIDQGDAIFIDAPNAQILIDGGPNGDVVQKLSAVMPFWDRSIDVVVSTHPHADHVTGLIDVLERYDVGEVWSTGQDYETEVYSYFQSFDLPPFQGGIEGGSGEGLFRLVSAGYQIDLGNGATLRVAWPESSLNHQFFEDPNDGSIVLMLEYGETSILLTGDIGIAQEQAILDSMQDIDVLKVGHHGSIMSSEADFLEVIDPEYSIISVGENDYGHPSPIILDRFRSIGSQVLRTDLDGDVRVLSNGGEPDISTWHLSP